MRVLVRVWRTPEESEERVLTVNHLAMVPQVALLGFQFRNPGQEPVGVEVLGCLT